MTTAEDIGKAVDAQQFDAAIERNAQAGKLDALADEAVAVHRADRSQQL
jgi:hypothetical protein